MAEVTQSQEWYVRSALGRALLTNARTIKEMRAMTEDETLTETWRRQADGILCHELQWQREAVAEFKTLPPELRPNIEMLDVG